MPLRVLYFFPHNPFRGLTGAHQRALEVLSSLTYLGCQVTLFGSTATSEIPWATGEAETTYENLCKSIVLHRPTWREASFLAAGRTAYHLSRRWVPSLTRSMTSSPLTVKALCPSSMRQLFASVIRETDPHVLFMNYAYWDGLIDHKEHHHRKRIIDTIDLLSLASLLRTRVDAVLRTQVPDPRTVPEEVFREDYFDSETMPADQLDAECAIYDQYQVTIAITEKEAAIISPRVSCTSVVHLPMTRSVCEIENSYVGPALFTGGLNPFNLHGYLYLCQRVLPRVRSQAPNFALDVTGAVCSRLAPQPNVAIRGVVPDLQGVYAKAGFFINPVYGGTGQQVKVVDAMAHGLPVVTLARGAVGSPVRHGENGLIARDNEEFADHILSLWMDRHLCRRLGQAARETVVSECSRDRLREGLRLILGLNDAPVLETPPQIRCP